MENPDFLPKLGADPNETKSVVCNAGRKGRCFGSGKQNREKGKLVMKARNDDPKREVIDKVVEKIQQRLTGAMAKDAEAFVRLFYKDVPPDDMAGRSVDSLYGAALTLYKFAQKRASVDTAKIRVYNPDLEEHGWTSDHTEINNTDMPFHADQAK